MGDIGVEAQALLIEALAVEVHVALELKLPAQIYPAAGDEHSGDDSSQRQQRVKRLCPPGEPQRRLYLKLAESGRLAPRAPVHTLAHLEPVAAGRQVAEYHCIAALGIDPAVAQPLEHIGYVDKLVHRRVEHIE